MEAFNTVKRPMKINERMDQSHTLGVGQPGIHESQLGRSQKCYISRHVQSNKHGVSIIETIVQIIRTGVE